MTRFTRASAPRHAIYFDLFTDAARNMEQAALLLYELLSSYPDRKELAIEILDLEHEGDRITHDVIDRLNHRDSTPIDHEDILALVSALEVQLKRGLAEPATLAAWTGRPDPRAPHARPRPGSRRRRPPSPRGAAAQWSPSEPPAR